MSEFRKSKPRIAVFGVGGAGGNAVNNLIRAGLADVHFIAANTDTQALAASRAKRRIQLGSLLTEGLGAGSHPEIGAAAAEESLDEIISQVFGVHMVFIAAGMGGGTGTGAASVIARAAKDLDILTVAVVTKPFHFEGSVRMRNAEAGILKLRHHVDTLVVIPNQNLLWVVSDKTSVSEAFLMADETLYAGIACIVDLIVKEGLIDLDFADVETVLRGMGTAMMGLGEAEGEQRAIRAAQGAIANPLIDEVRLKGAKSMLLSISGGRDMTLWEIDKAANRVRQEVDHDANIIVGTTLDESLGNTMRVSIVASGMPRTEAVLQGRNEVVPQVTWESQDAPIVPSEVSQAGWRLRQEIMERGEVPSVQIDTGPGSSAQPDKSVKRKRATKRSGTAQTRTDKATSKEANTSSDRAAPTKAPQKSPTSKRQRQRLPRPSAEDFSPARSVEQLGKKAEAASGSAQARGVIPGNRRQSEASPRQSTRHAGEQLSHELKEAGSGGPDGGKTAIEAHDFPFDAEYVQPTEGRAITTISHVPEALVADRRQWAPAPAKRSAPLFQRLKGLMGSK